MDRNDRQAIEALFDKLATVEQQSIPRDGESEALIRDKIARQPGAPYYMARTSVSSGLSHEARPAVRQPKVIAAWFTGLAVFTDDEFRPHEAALHAAA